MTAAARGEQVELVDCGCTKCIRMYRNVVSKSHNMYDTTGDVCYAMEIIVGYSQSPARTIA